jgi:phosphatidylglycerophosphate synthase
MAAGSPEYKVVDRSILLPFYRRFLVDPVLPLLPARLNPNTITHVGHLINLGGTVLLLALWPKRGWPFITAMVLLQIYMWCDNADGAHARRTNQCSALGEFLDHGLDALNTVYIAYLTAMALGLPPMGWVTIALVIPGAGAVTYWEQTQTGVFRLGLLNQVESVTVLSFALTMAAIFGNDVFEKVSLFGISAQRGFFLWCVATILFGMVRGMQRVAARDGVASVLPVAVFIAFGAAIAGAAAAGAISTIAAVTLATCANVHYGTRMLTLRLHHQLPKVEPALLAFTALLCSFIGWKIAGFAMNPAGGPLLATAACIVFGAQAIQNTRASLQQIAR